MSPAYPRDLKSVRQELYAQPGLPETATSPHGTRRQDTG